jgi:hypothetical protein
MLPYMSSSTNALLAGCARLSITYVRCAGLCQWGVKCLSQVDRVRLHVAVPVVIGA